jgi:NADH-quinone oxidoreductase subunit H
VNFSLLLVIKVVAVLLAMLTAALAVIYGELKISAHMQSRIGPYYAGVRWGWAQPIAEVLKFLQKEDIIPEDADRPLFKLAPILVIMGTLATFVVIPFGPDLVARDLDIGAFYALAVASIGAFGILLAGWSSANKYSLMGGLRAGAQLLAYELPLVLAVVAVGVQAETLSLSGIVTAQSRAIIHIGDVGIALPYVLAGQLIGFMVFTVAAFAELSRTPFDLPMAESELVMGYLTEYSGIRFTMFFLGEYAGMVSMAAIASTLFLGGYWLPGLSDTVLNVVGPLVLGAKIALLAFVMIWVRWTFPRLREDQLQSLAWRWLIPLGLANIAAVGFFKVVF